MQPLKITITQPNLVIGDFDQALSFFKEALQHADRDGSDYVVFPELFLGGYPSQDLWFDPGFWTAIDATLAECYLLSSAYPHLTIIMGAPYRDAKRIYNAGLVIEAGDLKFVQYKRLLPCYDVFDEPRYFTPGMETRIFLSRGRRIGILICEDAWRLIYPNRYLDDPVSHLSTQNVDLVFHLNASPFDPAKPALRREVIASAAKRLHCPIVMSNHVGLQDSLIFDGQSAVCDHLGQFQFLAPSFESNIYSVSLTEDLPPITTTYLQPEWESLVYEALVMGIRDYVFKSGFEKVVLGLSGGIDSALTATLAVRALGAKNVVGILMPSPYSSAGSIDDALSLASQIGISTVSVPISSLYHSFQDTLSNASLYVEGTTLENLQSRIRGTILMAYSNQTQALVLSTGNKSELSVGYCTLYGDMNGSLSVLGDLYKTQVYRLATWINRYRCVIPTQCITKPPSAELRPHQTDQDSLPCYAILDAILEGFIENNLSSDTLIKNGHPKKWVFWIESKLHQVEFKRAQGAPVLRVSSKAFGVGRRFPILWKGNGTHYDC